MCVRCTRNAPSVAAPFEHRHQRALRNRVLCAQTHADSAPGTRHRLQEILYGAMWLCMIYICVFTANTRAFSVPRARLTPESNALAVRSGPVTFYIQCVCTHHFCIWERSVFFLYFFCVVKVHMCVAHSAKHDQTYTRWRLQRQILRNHRADSASIECAPVTEKSARCTCASRLHSSRSHTHTHTHAQTDRDRPPCVRIL